MLQGRRASGEPKEQADGTASGFRRVLDVRLVLSVVAAGIMSFSGVTVETAMNVTFPALMADFGIGTSTVQWMTTSYLLTLAIVVPTSSFLARRFRTRSVFMAAIAFYIAGITCEMLASSFACSSAGACWRAWARASPCPSCSTSSPSRRRASTWAP